MSTIQEYVSEGSLILRSVSMKETAAFKRKFRKPKVGSNASKEERRKWYREYYKKNREKILKQKHESILRLQVVQ